jgi:hypothetical protein
MTTIRQLIQTSPARANELFAKLADTSETAVKTRDKLFSELKEELELFSALEARHLFPALRKGKRTKKLVAEAIDDNKQTRKLLAELERTPKDSDEFTTKLAELRKVFQQHVRDGKNELLPAVLKALTDEQAEVIVDKIEAERAEIESAKREETEQRRAAARQQREERENVQRSAERLSETARASVRSVDDVARAAQDAFQNSVEAAREAAQHTVQQVVQSFSSSVQHNHDLAQRSLQNMVSVAQAGAVLARGFQDVSREWFTRSEQRLRRNANGLNALAFCWSVPNLFAVQSDIMRGHLESAIEDGRRVAELSLEVAQDAARTIADQDTKH